MDVTEINIIGSNDLPIIGNVRSGDYIYLQTSEDNTALVNLDDFVIGLENVTFSGTIVFHSTSINELSANVLLLSSDTTSQDSRIHNLESSNEILLADLNTTAAGLIALSASIDDNTSDLEDIEVRVSAVENTTNVTLISSTLTEYGESIDQLKGMSSVVQRFFWGFWANRNTVDDYFFKKRTLPDYNGRDFVMTLDKTSLTNIDIEYSPWDFFVTPANLFALSNPAFIRGVTNNPDNTVTVSMLTLNPITRTTVTSNADDVERYILHFHKRVPTFEYELLRDEVGDDIPPVTGTQIQLL